MPTVRDDELLDTDRGCAWLIVDERVRGRGASEGDECFISRAFEFQEAVQQAAIVSFALSGPAE